jgi:hypothetical protein
VPDATFAEAADAAAAALSQVRAVSSLRTDPDLAASARRRLLFARLSDVPLFWRVDIDIRAESIAADDHYDAGNPDARRDTGWLAPASAIENAIAAAKAAARGHAATADDLLRRGCERIGHCPAATRNQADAITNLAEACATKDPSLTSQAAELSQLVDHLLRSGPPA